MTPDDIACNCKAKSAAVGFGGEKGFEDSGKVPFWDGIAGVLHVDTNEEVVGESPEPH